MSDLNPYERFLDLRPVEEVLAATPANLESLVRSIGPESIALSPAPGKWSPAQILAHLADCEIAFAFRLRQTLAQTPEEGPHVLQPFDQDRWAATYAGISATEALATFNALRHWNLLLVRAVMPAAAHKSVTHPERGEMTFATLLETMAGHDLNHIVQLQALAGLGG
jgi:hypothetical protein